MYKFCFGVFLGSMITGSIYSIHYFGNLAAYQLGRIIAHSLFLSLVLSVVYFSVYMAKKTASFIFNYLKYKIGSRS